MEVRKLRWIPPTVGFHFCLDFPGDKSRVWKVRREWNDAEFVPDHNRYDGDSLMVFWQNFIVQMNRFVRCSCNTIVARIRGEGLYSIVLPLTGAIWQELPLWDEEIQQSIGVGYLVGEGTRWKVSSKPLSGSKSDKIHVEPSSTFYFQEKSTLLNAPTAPKFINSQTVPNPASCYPESDPGLSTHALCRFSCIVRSNWPLDINGMRICTFFTGLGCLASSLDKRIFMVAYYTAH